MKNQEEVNINQIREKLEFIEEEAAEEVMKNFEEIKSVAMSLKSKIDSYKKIHNDAIDDIYR